MTWLRRLRLVGYRLLTAVSCRLDAHDIPPGYHRVGIDECDYGRPVWDVPCRACGVLFAAQTDSPNPEFENRLAATMERHRAGQRSSRDRRPS